MTSSLNSHGEMIRRVAIGGAAATVVVSVAIGGGLAWGTPAVATTPVHAVPAKPAAAARQSKAAAAAWAFTATLTDEQKSALFQDYSLANAEKWSNLPQALSQNRIGVQTGTFTDEQWAALTKLLKVVSGSAKNEGYSEIAQLWNADDYLADNGGNDAGAGPGGAAPTGSGGPSGSAAPTATATATDSATATATDTATATSSAMPTSTSTSVTGTTYGRGNYYLAFLGTPSDKGTWELQFGGHHLAFANTNKNGQLAGATPAFRGVEPFGTFTENDTTNQPLNQEQASFSSMLTGLSSTELTTAKLADTYTDLVLGPGKDWQFPTTSQGVKVSTLDKKEKQLVLAAIATYVKDVDDSDASKILAQYKRELDQTYVSYSGTTAVTERNDYVRIDGPSVWIEYSVQSGVVLSGNHPHSVWRDKTNDYGGTQS